MSWAISLDYDYVMANRIAFDAAFRSDVAENLPVRFDAHGQLDAFSCQCAFSHTVMAPPFWQGLDKAAVVVTKVARGSTIVGFLIVDFEDGAGRLLDCIMGGTLVFNRMRSFNGKKDVFLSNIAFNGKTPAQLAASLGMNAEKLGMILNEDGTQVFASTASEPPSSGSGSADVVELDPGFSPNHSEDAVEVKMAHAKESQGQKPATPKLVGDPDTLNATAEVSDPSENLAPLLPSQNVSNTSDTPSTAVIKGEKPVNDPFDPAAVQLKEEIQKSNNRSSAEPGSGNNDVLDRSESPSKADKATAAEVHAEAAGGPDAEAAGGPSGNWAPASSNKDLYGA
jgi:hypothetical protein